MTCTIHMPSSLPISPKQNRILALLNGDEYSRLLPSLELLQLDAGHAVFEAGDTLSYAYFPATCVFSLLGTTAEGASVELAMTGNDGMAGVPLVLGSETTTCRVVTRSSGAVYRLRAELMRWELEQGGELQRIALRYTQALMLQMAQLLTCSRHHSTEQQLCRWLLLSLERLPENQIVTTQEQLANLLGLRREPVAEAAGKLQQAGLIKYSRGLITVTDVCGLKARACECYQTVHNEYQRLFQLPPATASNNRVRPHTATLRMRAEARLKLTLPDIPSTPPDLSKLVRELQLRQIELEMHNEELGLSYSEADALRSRYADLYDFAPTGYCTVDLLGLIRQINLAAAILLGVKRSEVRRYRFGDAVAAESLPRFKQFLLNVLHSHEQQNCEIILSPTEQRPAAIVSITGVADETGHECRMVIVDVTEQRRTETRLRDSRAFNLAVLNSISAHVAVIDGEGTILAVNVAWIKFTAENNGEVLRMESCGWSYRDICLNASGANSEEAAVAWNGIEQVLNGTTEQFHLDYPCNSPTQERWFRMSVFPLQGRSRGAVVAHENITTQKQTELALRKRDQYQRALLDNFPFLVWLKDEQSRFLSVNQPFAVAFGWASAESLIGKTDYDIAPPDLAESYRDDDRAVLESGHSKHVVEQLDTEGELRWFETYKSPVSLDGRIIGTVGFAREVAERYRSSEAIKTPLAKQKPKSPRKAKSPKA